MSNLQTIIDQLRAAREELAESNAQPMHIDDCDCDSCVRNRMPERNVPYHHSEEAMRDAGMSYKDFG